MRTKSIIFISLFFLTLLFYKNTNAQDSLAVKKTPIKTIWDIPHKTFRQKWMWIHRSFVFQAYKERPLKYNTSYIKSNYKQLVITLPVSTRFLKFNLTDFKTGNKLNFAPNMEYNLGISISSRWASFIINSGIKLYSSENNIKGKTEQQDYQLNLYTRKITTDMFVQYYRGFYIKNSTSYSGYTSEQPYEIRSDVYAIHLGISSYYVANNKKFSYGSSFAFVEQQKKSAGSLLLGLYYSYFNVTGDPSLVSTPFRNDFDTSSYIRSGQTNDFGINLGYIYTIVVFKKFCATASLVQGFGGKHAAYIRDDKSNYNKLIGGAGKLHVRFALRYDTGKYFIGAMGIYDYILFNGKSNSTFDYSFGKYIVCIGYRFSVQKAEKKILRSLKLIDY